MSTAKRPPIVCVICSKPARREDRVRTRQGGHTHRSCLEQATRAGGSQAGGRGSAPAQAAPRLEQRRSVPVPAQQGGPGRPSRYPGTCPTCERLFPKGTPVVKVFAGWAHAACVFPGPAVPLSPAEREFQRNRDAVLSGETFRGHKANTWRLSGGSRSQ